MAGEPEKITYECNRPLVRGPQEKPVFKKPNDTGHPLKDILDIEEKEHDKEISQAIFWTYGIHTKCYVTCQYPSEYFDNYLMYFIKEDDENIQARKKKACERAFTFVNTELKVLYPKKSPKNLIMNLMVKEMKLFFLKMIVNLILMNQMHSNSII